MLSVNHSSISEFCARRDAAGVSSARPEKIEQLTEDDIKQGPAGSFVGALEQATSPEARVNKRLSFVTPEEPYMPSVKFELSMQAVPQISETGKLVKPFVYHLCNSEGRPFDQIVGNNQEDLRVGLKDAPSISGELKMQAEKIALLSPDMPMRDKVTGLSIVRVE